MADDDFFAGEAPTNYEMKCCCTLVVDISGSMRGDPLDELSAGLRQFVDDIKGDPVTADRLEITVVEFGSEVNCVQEPALVDTVRMPPLIAKGTTRMVDGVHAGIDKVKQRKQWYRETGQPFYRPWVILITDGRPDPGQNVKALAEQVRREASPEAREYMFFAIGVQGAAMDVLTRLSTPEMPPAQLKGLRFGEFFRWLSASMSTITQSHEGEVLQLPSPQQWMDGFQV